MASFKSPDALPVEPPGQVRIARRGVLAGGLSLGALGAMGGFEVWRRAREGEAGALPGRSLDFLGSLCDTLLPGSVATGAPRFVALLVTHSTDAEGRAGFAKALDGLASDLRRVGGAPFGGLPAARRLEVLDAYDRRVMSGARARMLGGGGGDLPLYVQLKGLVLTAYYTSEPGASKDLRYEPVPGRWDADIAVDPSLPAVWSMY